MGFGLVGGQVSIHETYVVNTFHLLFPEVSDEEIPVQLPLFLRRGTFDFVLPSTHSATCVDFGVVTHVRGGEGLACKVGDTITELVVTRHDKASLLAVKDVSDIKCCVTSIAMVQ